MALWLALILFAAGVVLVVKGGDWFVDAAGGIARAMGVPPFVVGATVVSVATTLPELLVSIVAAADGKTDMAVGNAIGSVTANTGLILAVSMCFMAVTLERKRYMGQCLILALSVGILWMGCDTGALEPWAGVFLAILFAGFMINNLAAARARRGAGEAAPGEKESAGRNAAFFVLGAAGVVLGSECLVHGGSAVAEALGVPERVVAVTMVAVGTSLPELVTALAAIRKKEAGLSVGNIIGANIIDLTLILPLCSLVSGRALPVSAASLRYDLPACLAVTAAALVPLLIRQKGSRLQGLLLLALYGGYLALTL